MLFKKNSPLLHLNMLWMCKIPSGIYGRIQYMKSKQQALNICATLFNVGPADVPDNLQPEIWAAIHWWA